MLGKPRRHQAPEMPNQAGASRPPRAGGPGQVRLIGGQWRRSVLPVADRPGLRPTPDRVRETLFNWLGQDLSGWRCLDAFAGSGALGFEAASRGAAEVRLIERDTGLAASLRQSAQRLKADAVRVEAADALRWMAACADGAYDLVLLDPPFDAALLAPALAQAARVSAGWIYLESGAPLPPPPEGWAAHRDGRAGAVHFGLLRRSV